MKTYIVGARQNRLDEAIRTSTCNVRFGEKITKKLVGRITTFSGSVELFRKQSITLFTLWFIVGLLVSHVNPCHAE